MSALLRDHREASAGLLLFRAAVALHLESPGLSVQKAKREHRNLRITGFETRFTSVLLTGPPVSLVVGVTRG